MKFYIDTHAHLNDEKLYNKLNEVIENAILNNVKRIFCVGYDINSSKKTIEISNNYDIVYSIIGIHPNSISEDVYEIENLISEKVIAIGEIGIDFYWNKFDKDIQLEGFKKQIEIAQKYELPIVLHLRDKKNSFEVFNIALEILKNYDLKSVVFHSFSGNEEIIKKILDRNYFVSFSGMLLYKNKYIQDALKITNMKNVFFETDSPYLLPPQLNEEFNEPKNVILIYKKASEILNKPLDEIIEMAFENINNCFNLKEIEMKLLYDWIYDNESLTENLSDDEAEKFYEELENFIEQLYNQGLTIKEIKEKIRNEKKKI
jgi:TatD DNase family protein